MKIKIPAFTFLFLFTFLASYSQYFEKSGNLSSVYINGPARFLTAGVNSVDYKGNIFHLVGVDPCMGCGLTFQISKGNFAGTNGWGFTFPINDPTQPNAYGYEDQNGNNYLVWQKDGILNYGGSSYNVTGGYNYALFKYSQNILQWIIDFDNGQALYSDMNDNVYVKKSNQLYRKYNSSGILIDSAQFTSAPYPSFMDSLGFFYTHANDTITKLDFQQNIIWQKNFSFDAVSYEMQGPYIFAFDSDSINLVDLNGNRIAYYNAAGTTGLRFDVNGNYYQGLKTKYNLFTGLVYNDPSIPFNSNIMDRDGRFYSFGYKDYSTISTTVSFFLPPSVFRNIGPISNSYWGEWFNWFQIFSTDTINKNLNFTLWNQNFFCSGSQSPSTFNFNINHYPHSLITNGFNVELYDTTGILPSPIVVGSSNHPPITISIPAGIPSDTNYRLRVVPNISGYTPVNNIIYNVKIRSTPTASIAFTNGITGTYPGNVYNCDTIHLSSTTNAINPIYLWQSVVSLGGGQYQYINLSATSTYDFWGTYMDYAKLTVTDSNGCSVYTTKAPFKLYVNPYQISNYDTVNALVGPLYLTNRYSYGIDTIFGNYVFPQTQGNNTNYRFYPDSAGQGMHYFTWKLKQQNIIGTITCLPDSVIDSVYVITTPFAHLSTQSNSQICKGTSVILQINLSGTPPFNFWLNEGAVTTGPYTTNQNVYYLTRIPLINTYFTLDSLTDGVGAYGSSWNGYVSIYVNDIPAPVIYASSSTLICQGDSVRLKRDYFPYYYNYSFQWLSRGVNIAGAVDSFYYAKTSGIYSIKATFNSLGCTKTSNRIGVYVGCTLDTSITANEKILATTEVHTPEINFSKSTGKLNFIFPDAFDFNSVELFDVTGRKISLGSIVKINSYSLEIRLPQLGNGIYFVKLNTNDKVITKKFFEE